MLGKFYVAEVLRSSSILAKRFSLVIPLFPLFIFLLSLCPTLFLGHNLELVILSVRWSFSRWTVPWRYWLFWRPVNSSSLLAVLNGIFKARLPCYRLVKSRNQFWFHFLHFFDSMTDAVVIFLELIQNKYKWTLNGQLFLSRLFCIGESALLASEMLIFVLLGCLFVYSSWFVFPLLHIPYLFARFFSNQKHIRHSSDERDAPLGNFARIWRFSSCFCSGKYENLMMLSLLVIWH